MGSSGAGKSSLLNAISGYITTCVSGHIKINHREACYITQEDHHQTLLTVEELMNFACDLKLKKEQRHKRSEIIYDILGSLNMNHRRDVNPHKLSGGEKKRLSIALELVANPKILFLDEPTSGLDEVTALQCIRLLSDLAKRGHTVVCTIHHPSATIFNYFDHVYVLGRGRCVYQGAPKALVPFLRKVAQQECPTHYSPPDFIIELCESEEGNLIEKLSENIRNGKLVYTDAIASTNGITPHHLLPPKKIEKSPMKMDGELNNGNGNHYKSAVNCQIVDHHNTTTRLLTVPTTDETLIKGKNGAAALLQRMKAISNRFYTEQHKEVSAFQQFYILFRVMMLRMIRARIPIIIQLLHHSLVGLCIGAIFWKLGNQGSYMFAHLKFCISTILMIAYTQIIIPTLTYPLEIKVIKKETFNNWYSLAPYYVALCLSRLPLQIFYNVLYLTITYWMTGFPPQWWRFAMFLATGIMISVIAEGIGLTIGSMFSILNGSVVGPLCIAVFIGTGIYAFDFMQEISQVTNILLTLSFMRTGCKALILSLFGYEREVLDCNEIYCHFSDPRVLIKFLDLQHTSFHEQMFFLLLTFLFVRVILYLGIRHRCKS